MINYEIKRISTKDAKRYIHENHYSHGSHNAPSPCYGLFDSNILIGVCMFATPCSENVRASIFGKEYVGRVIELHRLHIIDGTPKNTESWFISRCLSLLHKDRPTIWACISFSDATMGHRGTIYRATNALFYGMSQKARFYLDENGRLRHPRQCGKNITVEQAKKFGWKPTMREGKFRYLWFLPESRSFKRKLMKMSLVKFYPYVKEEI